MPTTSTGVGNSAVSGSSVTTTPGAARSTSHASARPTGRENTACTATECVVTTGTRTHVAETRSEGRPSILRDSLRIFSSSDDQPSGLSEPAPGHHVHGQRGGERTEVTDREPDITGPLPERPRARYLVHLRVQRVNPGLARARRRPGTTRPPVPRARTPGAARPRPRSSTAWCNSRWR